MSAEARGRGKAYECACGEEQLHLTRQGPTGRHDGWSYLAGECGGGVKLRFKGAKVVEVRKVLSEELQRIQALPARKADTYTSMLDRVDEEDRHRLDEILIEVREALEAAATRWMLVGERFAEAKKLLKRGDFGLWAEHNGVDRTHAHKFITLWVRARALPGETRKQFASLGQEKAVLLTRLPEVKQLEVLEDGVLIDGRPTPIERVTFRQLNAYVRSVVGKNPRGRKGKSKPAADKPKERMGLEAEVFEAFQAVMKGLQALKKKARDGWTDKEQPAARRLWGNVNHLFFHLQDELGMVSLLSVDGR